MKEFNWPDQGAVLAACAGASEIVDLIPANRIEKTSPNEVTSLTHYKIKSLIRCFINCCSKIFVQLFFEIVPGNRDF